MRFRRKITTFAQLTGSFTHPGSRLTMSILSPEEIAQRRLLLNDKAQVVKHGLTYRLNLDELQAYQWSWSNDSSWFQVAIIELGKRQLHGPLSRAEVLQLVADTLRTTVADLEQTMDWNANYMAWHDGYSVEEVHVWPAKEGRPSTEGQPTGEGASPPAGTSSSDQPA